MPAEEVLMPVPFGQLHTPGGYQMDEVASALQKSIRRGDERGALFWATELDLAGYANYAFKRLRIIASEDVGLADTGAAIAVHVLWRNWLEQRSKKDDPPNFARVFLVHAVCVLARAPKSRMLDHILMTMYEGERPQLEVPDCALDKHTARGRRMKRGLEHFFAEGAQLENVVLPDPYAEEGRAAAIAAAMGRPRRSAPAAPADGQLELDEA
jgi:replication-associated recombination protein RarA